MATATLAFDVLAIPAGGIHANSGLAAVRQEHNLADGILRTDLGLVSKCLNGDEGAWEELIRQHTRKVYGLCYRFTGSGSQAQDLTQEVFLRVFRTLRTFRAAEGSFGTWLARLTRNLLIDHYRRTRQERVTDSIEEQLPRIEESNPGAATTPDHLVKSRETSEILQAALQKLSPDLREAVILRDLQEMDYREIATVLNIPEGTVKSRINRGRGGLARLLRKRELPV